MLYIAEIWLSFGQKSEVLNPKTEIISKSKCQKQMRFIEGFGIYTINGFR